MIVSPYSICYNMVVNPMLLNLTMERTPGDDYPYKIKSLRAKLGLTQVALAETLGVFFPTVNRWENGKDPTILAFRTKLA